MLVQTGIREFVAGGGCGQVNLQGESRAQRQRVVDHVNEAFEKGEEQAKRD